MHILVILGVCYFHCEQGPLKSKPTFYHSSDDTFELSFSETWYHKGGPSNLMFVQKDYLLPIFSIVFPKFQDIHWSYVVDIPRSSGILVIILPCEVLVSAFILAILHQQSSITIYSVRPTMCQVVISIDLPHHG